MTATAVRPGQKTRRRRDAAAAYTLLIPSMIGTGIFLLIPVIAVAVLSLFRWDLISPAQFIGFDNYAWLADNDRFLNSLWVTVQFVAMAIPASVFLGLLIAVALNRRMPGTRFLQVLYVLPWVCAPLALGVVWQWLFDPSRGAINAILGQRIEWMSNENLALPAIAFVYIWTQVGYISLFFLAGLQSIPSSVYEAAKVDGAGPSRIFFSITMPLVMPTTFFVSVTQVIASFQVFDLVYGLTGGASGYPRGSTDVIAARIYQEAFVSLNLGRASAMAVILFLVLVVITVIQQRYFSRRITYDMS